MRGAIGLPNHVRDSVGPGWALVGDAAYHRDPITSHGITDAFRDAELLTRATDTALRDPARETDAMAGYQSDRDAAIRETFRLTRALSAFPETARFVRAPIRAGSGSRRRSHGARVAAA